MSEENKDKIATHIFSEGDKVIYWEPGSGVNKIAYFKSYIERQNNHFAYCYFSYFIHEERSVAFPFAVDCLYPYSEELLHNIDDLQHKFDALDFKKQELIELSKLTIQSVINSKKE